MSIFYHSFNTGNYFSLFQSTHAYYCVVLEIYFYSTGDWSHCTKVRITIWIPEVSTCPCQSPLRFGRIGLLDRPITHLRRAVWIVYDQINGFARATEIPISFVIWFSWKFRIWMVLYGSLLDQFVSSLARANVLSKFELDADWFINFLTRILINRFKSFNGLETFILLLIYRNQRSRFMLELMVIFVSI